MRHDRETAITATGTRSREPARRKDPDAASARSRSVPPPGNRPTVQVIRDLRGLGTLAPLWDAAAGSTASPMESHDWVRSWAEAYGVDRDLEILVAGDWPAVAIAPLVRSSHDGLRLELSGPPDLQERMDFLYADPSHVAILADALARRKLPLRFWRIPADSAVVAELRHAYRGRGIVRCRPGIGCPYIPLDDTWADPDRQLDARRRSNLRRARRIAEEMGPVTVEILSPRPADLGPLLQEAYAVEAAGWKGHSGKGEALVRQTHEGEFFRRYAAAACEREILRLCFLRIGGRAAAMKLAVITGGRFWLLKMGYSEEFERCSPGTLLLAETLRYAARSGLRSYEFLGGDESWIRAWEPLSRPCVSIHTYPFTARGAAALAHDARAVLRERAGAAKRAIGGRVQRTLARRASRAYVAGPRPEDALALCRALEAHGFRTTIGYVDGDGDSPRAVADVAAHAIDAIGDSRLDCYASLKAPVLRFSRTLLRDILERARVRNVGVHFDALGVEDADETFALLSEIRDLHPDIGCTLPGRWRRSVADVERTVDLGLSVRIVKGEWPDHGPEPDPRTGCLAVVERIAGRVRHAAVATHDPILAREALRRLRSSGTSCELEVLMGYPIRRVLPVALAEGVPIRVYVPYGHPELPYSIGRAARDLRIAGWALRDVVRGSRSSLSEIDSRGSSAGLRADLAQCRTRSGDTKTPRTISPTIARSSRVTPRSAARPPK